MEGWHYINGLANLWTRETGSTWHHYDLFSQVNLNLTKPLALPTRLEETEG